MKNLIIGMSENTQYTCFVPRPNNENIEFVFVPKPNDPMAILREKYPNCTLIRSIPHHVVWRKITFYPRSYTEEMIFRQVLLTLQQQLPLPLNEMFIDYHVSQLDEHIRVALFALRKSFADPLKAQYRQTILDCELHCWLRGYLYQQNPHQQIDYAEEFIINYLSEHSFRFGKLYVRFAPTEVEISPHPIEGTSLFELDELEFSAPTQILDMDLYLTALGATQWNGAS